MEKFRSSHDISHCDNDACSLKHNCTRFLAHLDAIERGLDYLTYFVMEKLDNKNCDVYIPWKKREQAENVR
jgi:hypothetical protein